MDVGGFHWFSIEVIGVIILGVILLWAVLRNQRRGESDDTAQGTRNLYAEEEQRHKAGTDTKPD